MVRRSSWIARSAACLVLAFLFLSPQPALARAFDSTLPFEVTARQIEYEGERQIVIAEGQVRLSQPGTRLDADWVAFNQETGQGVASGNVVLVEGVEVLEAAFIEFAIDTIRGFVLKAHYDTGPGGFIVSASQLTRTGVDTYDVSDADFTTCRCPDEEARRPWSIQAEETDLEVGGYAYSKNAKLTVLDVPIIWLPRMIFPVKTDRESGVLFPELDIGTRNGFDVGLPVFWAARENVNVTLTPRYLSEKGFKGDLDVEAVYGERSYTNLFAAYVRDQQVDDFIGEQPYSENRWSVLLRDAQDLPWELRSQTDLLLVSDNDYVVDFNEMRRHRSDNYLESRANVGRSFGPDGRFAAIGGVRLADDMQNTDKIDRDPYLLQRLPELSLTALPGSLGPLDRLVASMDADYIHFTWKDAPYGRLNLSRNSTFVVNDQFIDIGIGALPTDNGVPVLVTPFVGDGIFEEGEPIADRGHRVLLHPRLGLPLRIADALDLSPEIGYQQLLYDSNQQGFAERGMITAKVDLATQLHGGLDLPLLPGLEHTLEPRLSWAYVRPTSQTDNPLYIPGTRVPQTRVRQLSLDNVLLDPADRVDENNRVRLSAANRFYRASDGDGLRPLWADVTVSADYDFAKSEWGTFVIDGNAYPSHGPRTRFIFGYDLQRTRIDEAMIDISTPLPYQAAMSVRYRYLRRIPLFFEALRSESDFDAFDPDFRRVNQFDVSFRLPLKEIAARVPWISRFTLIYALSYSFEDSLRIGNRGGIEYTSKCHCWAVGLDLREDRVRGVEVGFRYTVLGLGEDQLGGSILDEGLGEIFGGN